MFSTRLKRAVFSDGRRGDPVIDMPTLVVVAVSIVFLGIGVALYLQRQHAAIEKPKTIETQGHRLIIERLRSGELRLSYQELTELPGKREWSASQYIGRYTLPLTYDAQSKLRITLNRVGVPPDVARKWVEQIDNLPFSRST